MNQAKPKRRKLTLALDILLALLWAAHAWPLLGNIAWRMAEAGHLGDCFEGECLYRATYVVVPAAWLIFVVLIGLGLWLWPGLTRYLAWTALAVLLLLQVTLFLPKSQSLFWACVTVPPLIAAGIYGYRRVSAARTNPGVRAP